MSLFVIQIDLWMLLPQNDVIPSFPSFYRCCDLKYAHILWLNPKSYNGTTVEALSLSRLL